MSNDHNEFSSRARPSKFSVNEFGCCTRTVIIATSPYQGSQFLETDGITTRRRCATRNCRCPSGEGCCNAMKSL